MYGRTTFSSSCLAQHRLQGAEQHANMQCQGKNTSLLVPGSIHDRGRDENRSKQTASCQHREPTCTTSEMCASPLPAWPSPLAICRRSCQPPGNRDVTHQTELQIRRDIFRHGEDHRVDLPAQRCIDILAEPRRQLRQGHVLTLCFTLCLIALKMLDAVYRRNVPL